MRRARLLLLVVLAGVVLASCRIDTTVAVRVDEQGAGTVITRVALDAEAVRAAEAGGKTLEERVRLTDLTAAGWTVSPWRRATDGGATLVITHPFANPAEMEGLFRQLDGTKGPLHAVALDRDTSLARTQFHFHCLADLAGIDAGVTDDAQLAANLTDQRVDVSALDASLTAQLRRALHMQVAVSLPGDAPRIWVVPAGERRVLATSSASFDAARAAWIAAGILLAGAALTLVLVGEARARRRRRADPATAAGSV